MAFALTNLGTLYGDVIATLNITLGVNVPAGSLIVAVCSDGAAITGTFTDTVGNTYTKAADNGTICIFYAFNCIALASGQHIIYHKNDSTNGAWLSAFYVTGALTTNPLDAATVATSTGPNTSVPTITSGTPTQPGELFVAAVIWDNNGTTGFTQASGGWATPPVQINDGAAALASQAGGSRVNAGSAAVTYAPTVAANFVSYNNAIVGFKPQVVSAGGGNMPMLGM